MNNKKIFEKIITEKRAKSSNERPKYGLRKLTVGVVSCLLGYMMFFTPNVVVAEKVDQPQAVEATVESTEVANPENVEEESKQPKEEAAESTETKKPVSHVQAYSSNAKETNAQDRSVKATAEETTEETAEKTTNFKLTEEQKQRLIDAGLTEEEIVFVEADINEEIIEDSNFDVENYIKQVIEVKKAGGKIIPEAVALKSPAEDNLPKNITKLPNWDEKEKKGDDYWELGKSDELKDQRLVRVTTSDPIEFVDVNYQGYFVDANGRTNLRLTYLEKSAAISSVWKKAAYNFGKLFDKIDFDKSYGVGADGTRQTLSHTNNDNIKTLNIGSMVGDRTQNKNNLPINIVLKDGVTIDSLGQEDYKIQMRLVDANGERVYAFAPGKASLDYSTYTRTTSVSLKNNMNSEFLRGPGQQKGDILAVQRSFMSEFIANPEQYNETTNLGVIRTQYQSETGANPGNTTDGKPHGFMQMFDADMVKYLKADDAGFIAYTQLLNADRTVNKNAKRVGITLDDLNYTADGKLAYFIIGESNFQKKGVKVVRTDKMKGSVYQSGIGFTAIDYVVDKAKFTDTFESTGKSKVDFSTMTGWIETNPKGWTIYEEVYDHDYVVQEGDSFTVDLGKDPEGSQIMIQVGDEVHSFVRTQQGYYAGYKGGSKGFEKIEKVVDGIYKVTLREGASIKAGDKIRILLPDSNNHDADNINFVEISNGSKKNQGAATLEYNKDRNIDLHIFSEGTGLGKLDGTFKMIYTPKGSKEQVTVNITKNKLKTYWQHDDKNGVLKGTLVTTTKENGNYVINTSKVEPGTSIIVDAYDPDGNKLENLTSKIEYNPIDKATEKYTKMAWVDHSDDLAGISIQKSLFTPYQEIFTNDYTGDQQKDFYENPRQNPKDAATFMKNTSDLLGFTKYDGGKIRMR
ncbi:MAG: YSIRK-type signal peptide-containing protein, partial [Finegoldia magna]|nr:YSIRK-type signal peptide-containing protein [Finegoldia magna]